MTWAGVTNVEARVHKFVELNIKLSFVFDGFDNELKKIRRLEQRQEATRRRWKKQAAADTLKRGNN